MVSWMGLNYQSEQFTPPGMWWSSTIWRVLPAAPAASAPPPAVYVPPPTPTVAPVLDNNVSVSVYGRVIPISAGKRRLPGDLIWLKNDVLNTEGDYTANAAYSFGYRLIQTTANLVKVWANGVKLYDATTGFTAEGFTFVFYDGSQTAVDPEIAANKGAAITPAYKHQLYLRGVFPTKEFNGSLPNISVLVADDPAGYRQFLPWAPTSGSGETLNPDDCAAQIDLTNANHTATRVTATPEYGGPYHWQSVRGTKGRAANQADGYGWFAFEARNDHIATHPEDTPLAIFPEEYQGPGLASEAFNIDGGSAGNAQSLMATSLGNIEYNNGATGIDTLLMGEGDVTMFAVRLDVMKLWKGIDSYYGWNPPNPVAGGAVGGSPIDNTGGIDISYLAGQGLIFPAWFSLFKNQSGTLNLTGSFENTPPGWTSGAGATSASTLTEIIVAVGIRCGFGAEDFRFVGLDDIRVTGIVITSDTDLLTFLKNAGRVYGFDYTESGGQVLCRKSVIGTTYTVDIDDIPESALIPVSNEAAVTTTRDSSHRPEIIELSYQDETIDYQPSVQRARIPRVKSPMSDKFGIPFVMTAQEAITGCSVALYREQVQRISHSFQLPFQYQRIEPTDLVQFTSSGKAYTAKVVNVVRNSDLSVKVTAVNLLTAEAETLTDNYRGEGYSGDPNIDNVPLEIVFTNLDFSDNGNAGYLALLEDI